MTSVQPSAVNDNLKRSTDDELVEVLRRVVEKRVAACCGFVERERAALEAANEAVRRMLELQLEQQSKEFSSEILVDGIAYRRHQPGSTRYFSLCGELRVARWTYRLKGERNGPTKVPLELAAGLVEGATPALAYALAQGYANSPIRWVEANLRSAHRRPPSRSTLDRMAKAIGTSIKARIERIENQVRRSETIPDQAVAINLGLDRTTVPMEEAPDPEHGDRKCSVHYRMAYVGTVCFTDLDAKPLCTRRYAAPAHVGPAGVLRRMISDLKHALRNKPHLRVGVVQDNAPELWNLIRAALRREPAIRKHGWRETVDWYHLMEYFARVLDALVEDARIRQKLLAQWRQRLQRSDRAIAAIDNWIFRRFQSVVQTPAGRKRCTNVLGIYLVYRAHFRYASMKKLGLHRGSGVTEGACKSMIAMRAKRSGQRWRPPGIAAVLTLKSLVDSERLPAFWEIFTRRYQAVCVAA